MRVGRPDGQQQLASESEAVLLISNPMAAVRHRHHQHIQAPKPTWIAIGSTPPAPASRDAACRKLAAYSPLLLPPPSVWQKDKRPKDDVDGGVPVSPRISCMGQVKGGRRCASARGPAARGPESDYAGAGGGSLAGLVMELFGRRRGRGKGRKSRACSRVRGVPSDSSSSSSSSWGSTWGARAPAPVCLLDPPLPVASPPARDDNAPSLWERRRGGGRALDGLVFAQV